MADDFFSRPILNSPYEYPARYWELDADGQPTQQIVERRRPAQFITPIPKPKKKKKAGSGQAALVFDEAIGGAGGVFRKLHRDEVAGLLRELGWQ